MKPVDPRLLRAGRATAGLLVAGAALALAAALLVVVQAWLLATGISRVIERGGTQGLAPLLGALVAVVAGRALLGWAHESLARRAATSVKSTLRQRLARRAADDAVTGGGPAAPNWPPWPPPASTRSTPITPATCPNWCSPPRCPRW
ncbi:MAG: hypothetical protein R2694_04125 [Ilumatobacteraceae bacterium]